MKRIKLLIGLEASEGGAAKHVAYLVQHLDRARFDICLVVSRKRESTLSFFKADFPGIRMVHIDMARSLRLGADWKSYREIRKIMRREQFDVLHCHSTKAGLLFRLAARGLIPRVIYSPHAFYFQGKSGLKKRLAILMERILSRRGDLLICVSETERKLALQHRIQAASQIRLIPNVLPPDFVNAAAGGKAIRAEQGISGTELVFGWIGRLVPQKDPFCFLKAAGEFLRSGQEAYFFLLGQGEMYPQLKDWLQDSEWQDRIVLAGHQEEVAPWLDAMDVLVTTSEWEAAPYSLLEGMAMNKRILASDIEAHREILPQKDRHEFFPFQDFRALANKMKMLPIKANGVSGGSNLPPKDSFRTWVISHERIYNNL